MLLVSALLFLLFFSCKEIYECSLFISYYCHRLLVIVPWLPFCPFSFPPWPLAWPVAPPPWPSAFLPVNRDHTKSVLVF